VEVEATTDTEEREEAETKNIDMRKKYVKVGEFYGRNLFIDENQGLCSAELLGAEKIDTYVLVDVLREKLNHDCTIRTRFPRLVRWLVSKK
jgi:hypothetical protein